MEVIDRDEYFHQMTFNNLTKPTIMSKPMINATVVISQGEIIKMEMNEGTGPDDRKELSNEIQRLIMLRNIVEAEIQNYEKKVQRQFLDERKEVSGE